MPGTGSARFTVPDMSCSHCVGVIRDALERELPGAAVTVDLASHTVTVGADATRAAEVIRDAGYEPVVAG